MGSFGIFYVLTQIYSVIKLSVSACILRMPSPVYTRVLQYCDQVIEMSSTNTKALFRKGVALYHLGEPEKAIHVLEKAQKQPGGEGGE